MATTNIDDFTLAGSVEFWCAPNLFRFVPHNTLNEAPKLIQTGLSTSSVWGGIRRAGVAGGSLSIASGTLTFDAMANGAALLLYGIGDPEAGEVTGGLNLTTLDFERGAAAGDLSVTVFGGKFSLPGDARYNFTAGAGTTNVAKASFSNASVLDAMQWVYVHLQASTAGVYEVGSLAITHA